MRDDVHEIAADYEDMLATRGAVLAGVGWSSAFDLALRYGTLLSRVDFRRFSRERPLRLLDLGCGPGFLLDYLASNDLLDRVDYTGVDVSEVGLAHARRRWPQQRFERRDVRDQPFDADEFDFCMICGVFSSRCGISFEAMRDLAQATLRALWPSLAMGLAFNVYSKHVDYEREDLFHWALDEVMAFCKRYLSRHVSFHLDYGLWDLSVLVSREPVRPNGRIPEAWALSKVSAAPTIADEV
ncbi:MAG TPA: class I SAM-dependent methyltransferase [Stellaceae bacterium]|nr:class I SAM-dependent methyltransferase [Stellaceae bacterium]